MCLWVRWCVFVYWLTTWDAMERSQYTTRNQRRLTVSEHLPMMTGTKAFHLNSLQCNTKVVSPYLFGIFHDVDCESSPFKSDGHDGVWQMTPGRYNINFNYKGCIALPSWTIRQIEHDIFSMSSFPVRRAIQSETGNRLSSWGYRLTLGSVSSWGPHLTMDSVSSRESRLALEQEVKTRQSNRLARLDGSTKLWNSSVCQRDGGWQTWVTPENDQRGSRPLYVLIKG